MVGWCGLTGLHAQGTAFTYQGRLLDQGGVASGRYEMEFGLHDAVTAGTRVAGPLTNSTVAVSNGVFTVTIDFGTGAFTGNARWLQVGVRTNGSGAVFGALTPRQAVTAAPYAVMAGNLNGVLPDAQLSANIPRLNGTPTFTGDVTIASPYDLNFGASTRQMINLFGLNYSVGVQNNTLYQRTDGGFAWFRQGTHNNNQNNAGTGGTNLMVLDFAGHLQVNAGVTVDLPSINNGSYYPGLVFGAGSGESIASKRTPGGHQYGIDFYTGFNPRLSIANNGNVGIGTTNPVDARLDLEGTLRMNGNDIWLQSDANRDHGLGYRASASGQGIDGPFVYGYNGGALGVSGPDSIALKWDYNGNVWISNNLDTASLHVRAGADIIGAVGINTGVGTIQFRNDSGLVPGLNLTGGGLPGIMRLRNALEIWPSDNAARAGYLDVRATNGAATIQLNGANGEATVKVLTITGGADIAEPFQISGAEIPKGAVVVIDEERPGRVKMSAEAYDTRVAGIVSGANGVNPGLALHQEGAIEGGQNVALSGRVYALADATGSPIKAGDLLTTSSTPGHIMKVTERARGAGAILGKAMSELKEGRGLVLVLVNLQ